MGSISKISWTHILMVNQSMTKEARIYNGKKMVSSTSAAGKTGQLHVKNEIRTFSNTFYLQK